MTETLAVVDTRLLLTTEEIGAICGLTNLPPVIGLPNEDVVTQHCSSDAGALASGLRSLLARGVAVAREDGSVSLPRAVRDLVAAAGAPDTSAVVRQEAAGGVRIAVMSVCGTVGVERIPTRFGVHALTPFAATDLRDRIAVATGLTERQSADVPAFDVSFETLDTLGARLRDADYDGAAGVLRDRGVPADSARAFLDAAAHRVATCEVVVQRRLAPTLFTGVQTAWIDGGDHGLWSMPPAPRPPYRDHELSELVPDADRIMTKVAPVTAAALWAEIDSALAAAS